MLSVDDAIAAVLEDAAPLGAERIGLSKLAGRIAAEDVKSRLTQPPFSASAMDGYAVCFSDMKPGAVLKVVGEAPAGAPYDGRVGAGEAVRIFTGAAMPEGADHVVIQEHVTRTDDFITINEAQDKPCNVRAAGIDFSKGDILARAGERLHEIHGSIFAAANIDSIAVRRRPKIALFTNGDELMEPGAALKPGEIDDLGLPHPRSYGTFPRVIAEYVKRRPVLTLEDAVRKMTGWPAQRMGLSDRGLVRQGMRADVVVFDYEALDDVAGWTNPVDYPKGIETVIVNGRVALDKGKLEDVRAGAVLRHSCS